MAIPLQELRLGNWVLMNNRHIHMDTRIFHAVLNGFDGYVPEPVFITEDILDKCSDFGRMDNNGEPSFFNGDDIIIRIADMSIFAHSELDGSVMWLRQLKYVHQLQNLYFFLTDTELQITF